MKYRTAFGIGYTAIERHCFKAAAGVTRRSKSGLYPHRKPVGGWPEWQVTTRLRKHSLSGRALAIGRGYRPGEF